MKERDYSSSTIGLTIGREPAEYIEILRSRCSFQKQENRMFLSKRKNASWISEWTGLV